MRRLPTTEDHRDLDLVPAVDQLANRPRLEVDVVLTDLGAEPHLAEFLRVLSLAKLPLLLGLLIAIAAVVKNAANRWLRPRGHLNQVKAPIQRHLNGVCRMHHSNPFPRVGHHKDLRHGDSLVDAIISRYVYSLAMRFSAVSQAALIPIVSAFYPYCSSTYSTIRLFTPSRTTNYSFVIPAKAGIQCRP